MAWDEAREEGWSQTTWSFVDLLGNFAQRATWSLCRVLNMTTFVFRQYSLSSPYPSLLSLEWPGPWATSHYWHHPCLPSASCLHWNLALPQGVFFLSSPALSDPSSTPLSPSSTGNRLSLPDLSKFFHQFGWLHYPLMPLGSRLCLQGHPPCHLSHTLSVDLAITENDTTSVVTHASVLLPASMAPFI